MCRQAARPVAGRLSEDRIDSAPECFSAALDPRALHQASLVAGRLAMHLQGRWRQTRFTSVWLSTQRLSRGV